MELSTVELATVLKTLMHSSTYVKDSELRKEIQQAATVLKTTTRQAKPMGGSRIRIRSGSDTKVKELFEMFGLKRKKKLIQLRVYHNREKGQK